MVVYITCLILYDVKKISLTITKLITPIILTNFKQKFTNNHTKPLKIGKLVLKRPISIERRSDKFKIKITKFTYLDV